MGAFIDVTARKQAEIDRVRLLDHLHSTLDATVQTLASAMELRDPFTAGHQRRVSRLAATIAQKLHMDEDRTHGLWIAGLLHDIGKLVVPAELLSKTTRLSNAEMELIRQHPGAGYDLLKCVDFGYPVADMVHQHHERMDGSGYPLRLAGDQILMESRILAVADVVEAMLVARSADQRMHECYLQVTGSQAPHTPIS